MPKPCLNQKEKLSQDRVGSEIIETCKASSHHLQLPLNTPLKPPTPL